MNRIFKVTLSKSMYPSDRHTFETVAPTAEKAIAKARAQVHRDHLWRGAWIVEEVYHRGPAV